MRWVHEGRGRWDADKARIVGGAPEGAFDSRYRSCRAGDAVPGEWWRVERDARVVGYGWLDVVWGDAEILLATDPAEAGHGVGTFVLDHLEQEARAKGLNHLYNLVRPTHPRAEDVTRWLGARGFGASTDGRLLRVVKKL